MKKLIAVVVAIVLALLIAGGVWHARASHGDGDDGSDGATHVVGTDRGAPGVSTSRRDRVLGLPSWAAQAGVAARRIAGRVVLDGKPVANATVRLGVNLASPGARTRASLGSQALTLVAVVRTTAAGEFDFGLQPAASFVVSAEAANAAPASISVVVADPHVTPPPEHLVIALADCRSRMSGRVRDAAGAIARALVRVAGLAGAETDADGHYALCVPMTTMTGATVEADGYGTITAFIPSLHGDIHQDFVLVPEATLAGMVVDEAGLPVAAAAVIADPVVGDERHESSTIVTTADGDGRFQLSRAAPGRYRVRAIAERSTTAEPALVIATAGPAIRELRLVVVGRARVHGHVMMSGTPIAGAIVTTGRTDLYGRSLVTATSQSDGSFVLDGLAPGTVTLVAKPYEVRSPASLVVDRADINDVMIEVSPKATVRGRVTRHHEPVGGVRVRCTLSDDFAAVTDGSGDYTLEGLPGGTGNMVAQDDKAGTQRAVTVTAGHTTTLDLELDSGGEIRGSVVDETGAAVVGVLVRFDAPEVSDMCQAMTDATGAFDCATLTGHADYQPAVFPSPAAQQAYRPAAGDQLARVHVADGDAVVSGVRLAISHEHLAIRGKVVDETGAVIADAHVSAGGSDPGFSPIRARADGDGGFVVDNLARGTYSLRAHAPDGGETEVSNVAAGASGVQLVIARPGRIDGTLVGFATPPHVFAEIPFGELDDPHEAIVTGNQFTFAALPPGTYNVDAMIAGVQLVGVPAQVRSGATTHVTLQRRARASVDGRLTDRATGAAIAGVTCFAFVSVDGSEAALFGTPAPGPQTDADGRFTVDAAVGRVRIRCGSPGTPYSEGGGDFDVAGPTHVDVVAVKRVAPSSQVGFRLASWTLPPTVISGDATNGLVAGDQIVSIDGVGASNLLPDAAMALAQNHRPGSSLVLQILRGGTPMTIRVAI